MNTVSSPQSPEAGHGPDRPDLTKSFAMLFGTPVTVHPWPDSEAVNTELSKLVLAKEAEEGGLQLSNVGGWHSKPDLFSWDADCVRTIRDHIGRMFVEMTRITMAELIGHRNIDFALKGWANVNRDRSYNLVHNHPNHVWSGTYYVATGTPATDDRFNGRLELLDPRNGVGLFGIGGRSTGTRCLVDPKPGTTVVFPSWLNHQVHPFHGTGARISIAFNVQISEVGGPAQTGD
jgi:uncharacterized protein (TIGR02466 family)